MMVGALKRGRPAFWRVSLVTQWLFDVFGPVVVFSNLLVLLTQLFAVIAPLRLRWLLVASLAYDVLHIGIYILGGLFFWP